MADFEFVRLLVKVSRQRAVKFVVCAGEKNKFVAVRREKFFRREAGNFYGKIFGEVQFRRLRGKFGYGFVSQKIFTSVNCSNVREVVRQIKVVTLFLFEYGNKFKASPNRAAEPVNRHVDEIQRV